MKTRFFNSDEWRILWPFYLEAFLGTLLFIMPPFIVLYFNNLGFSMSQIGILIAVLPLSSLIFEIPTGAIADLYGRKFSVMLGWICQGSLYFFLFLSPNFYYLLIILFLIGIAGTLSSGSYEAWVVDLLKKKRRKNLIHSYFTKRQSLYNLAFIFSGILGAFFVARFGVVVIWSVSGSALLISTVFLYFGEEIYKKKKAHIKKSFFEVTAQTKKSLAYSYKHHILYYLLLVSFIFGFLDIAQGFISWTPFLKSFNFPDYSFGYLWSATGVLGIIAPFLSQKLASKNREKKVLILFVLMILIYGFLVLIANKLSFLILLVILYYFLADFEAPVFKVYFHRFIPSKLRATIGSINSMLFSLAGIIALPLVGFLIDKIGARYTIFISTLFAIPVIFLYLKIKEK